MVNGPNLNWLGKREPHIYGSKSWEVIWRELEQWGRHNEFSLEYFQSNHEGALIDYLQTISNQVLGIVINPAALAHTGIALRDCVAMLPTPVIEIHLSPVQNREPFRRRSYLAEVAQASFTGFGWRGYLHALGSLKYLLK